MAMKSTFEIPNSGSLPGIFDQVILSKSSPGTSTYQYQTMPRIWCLAWDFEEISIGESMAGYIIY